MQKNLSKKNLDFSSMDDDVVEILDPNSTSASVFASRNSNSRRCEFQETLREGRSSQRKSLNPSQGKDLICTCEEKKVNGYLRSAVERKDFGFVLKTLRGRELGFRKSKESMEEEVKALKRGIVAVKEAEGKKFSKLMEEYEGLKIEHRETKNELEGLKIQHRKTELQLEGLRIKFKETISQLEGFKGKFTELGDISVTEIVPGCETPDRGQADAGVSTPFMGVSTPRSLEKSVEKEKEGCRVKRNLDFDNEDNAETQGKKHPDFPHSSVDNVVNKVLSPHCSVHFASNGLNLGVSEVDGLGNNGIGDRESHPTAILKRNEDEKITSCKKDGLQCLIPERKIDMEGSVDVGTGLRNDVVILSDSESESSGPSLRKRRLSPCSEKTTCIPKKQNIEDDIQSRVEIGGVSDDGGKYSDENEGQTLRRGAKRRCQMTVSSGSESSSSDVGFSCKRRKPRSGNLQTQVICEAECIKDTRENVQCETSPKGPKEDAVLGVPHEEEVEDVPDMKLKRIRKAKDVGEILTVGHCDEHKDEIQGEASPGARSRSLKRVLDRNELPDEGMCSVKTPPVTKYKRLKRGDGEADGPEKCNVGKVLEKSTLDPNINDGTIFNENGDHHFSIGGSTLANEGKSDRATKVAEGPSGSPIHTQNSRRLRSQSRKMINLAKESDGEDEDENDSQTDDLADFIVDSSESEKDSESADGNKSGSENSTNNLDSDAETNPSSGDDLHEVMRKISRQKETKLDWKYEGEMLAAFAKDDVICMRAVCALYRQQTNDEKRGKSSLYLNRRGFDKFHATRGSLLAEFLTDNDPFGPMKKSLQELRKHDWEGAQYCKDLASHHSKQLFEIYRNKEDPHFPYR